MKNQPQKCTATKGALGALLFAALFMLGNAAWAAQVAGVVARLSGPLMAKKADGSVKVLALRSEIESGDTLVSEKNTYAQIKFIDNSEITLRPGTTFKVENFSFDEGRPDGDNASYSLVKGGLRSITGLMGKRNKEKFSLKTPNATIGIRGTTFVVHYVPPPTGGQRASDQLIDTDQLVAGGPGQAVKRPAAPPQLAPGLHLNVTDGAIIVTNNGGALGFSAGQFGYVPTLDQPPVIVPSNPNLQFVPPPAFDAAAGAVAGTSGPLAGKGPGQGDGPDCIVR